MNRGFVMRHYLHNPKRTPTSKNTNPYSLKTPFDGRDPTTYLRKSGKTFGVDACTCNNTLSSLWPKVLPVHPWNHQALGPGVDHHDHHGLLWNFCNSKLGTRRNNGNHRASGLLWLSFCGGRKDELQCYSNRILRRKKINPVWAKVVGSTTPAVNAWVSALMVHRSHCVLCYFVLHFRMPKHITLPAKQDSWFERRALHDLSTSKHQIPQTRHSGKPNLRLTNIHKSKKSCGAIPELSTARSLHSTLCTWHLFQPRSPKDSVQSVQCSALQRKYSQTCHGKQKSHSPATRWCADTSDCWGHGTHSNDRLRFSESFWNLLGRLSLTFCFAAGYGHPNTCMLVVGKAMCSCLGLTKLSPKKRGFCSLSFANVKKLFVFAPAKHFA